jgi:hypothetical protein
MLIDDDFVVFLELPLFTFNVKREVCGVFNGFLSFLNKYEANKTHNMLSLMLDPKFQRLRLVSFVIG